MPRLSRKGLVVASIVALVLAPHASHAQTTAPTSTTTIPVGTATPCVATPGAQPTVSVSLQQVPSRIVNKVNLGTSTRPPSLNPNGVSYQDCTDNMTLEFPVTACNFTGQSLQVWASRSSDCTNPSDRGHGGIAVCWLVNQGSPSLQTSVTGEIYDIRVQDIVGPENLSPSPANMSSYGKEACTVQSTYVAVPININFIPINVGDNSTAGPAFQYRLVTDLVGPPAPAVSQPAVGDTLLTVNWTPNVDTDTAGYNVVIDPIPGMEPADATTSFGAPTGGTTVLVCPADSGMSIEDGAPMTAAEDASDSEAAGATPADAGDGEAPDASSADGEAPEAAAVDAMVSTPSDAATIALNDAGCYMMQVAGGSSSGTSNGGTCNDPLLSGGTVPDSGTDSAVVAPTVEFDDAGNPIVSEAGATTESGVGGIWMPPKGHIVNPDPTLGITATGETISTYTVTGLRNGTVYNVVVAAVDNFGNIGPPSTQVCDFPAPVNDFWKIYRLDGGQAGGGFCALEAVGAPAASTVAFAGAGALVVAGLRRRRSKRRR
jgi:hypothetical protein